MTTATKVSALVDLGLSYTRTELSTPVAMLNPESTLQDRICYCASIADGLRNLSDVLQEAGDTDTCRIAELFGSMVDPLASVLDALRSDAGRQGTTAGEVQP